MKNDKFSRFVLAIALTMSLAMVAAVAQETPAQTPVQEKQTQPEKTTPMAKTTATPTSLSPGAKMKVEGTIIERTSDGFTLHQSGGSDMTVKISNTTDIKEKKGNPFRGAKKYTADQLVRGLHVEVEGRADSAGSLVADKIRATDTNVKVAESIESRVNPVEGRVGTAETRLSESEENAKKMSGQLGELEAISNAAKGGAKAAQETADQAMTGVKTANERIETTNERIGSIDEYEKSQSVTILFKVGSSVLNKDAEAKLDELAAQAKDKKGFVIEIAGFASSDGSEALNRRLSQARAQSVAQYLAEKHDIPLRRIMMPSGYGESHPAADNKTRTGRKENRRVEVSLLVSRGLTTGGAARPTGSESSAIKQ